MSEFRLLPGNTVLNYRGLLAYLERAGLADWAAELRDRERDWFKGGHHGDLPRWMDALQSLPPITNVALDLKASAVTIKGDCANDVLLEDALRRLSPWRKGPFRIAGIYIDTEWRSDFKWDRVIPHLGDLRNRRILDVGCGNGYHAWRMLAADPSLIIGIDPSVLFNLQFQAIQHYANDARIYLLPLTLEQMPKNLQWFDTVFSMGVLYHRRSPFDHLLQLKGLLKPGGELCLETLVIEGGAGQVLVPGPRYARMNNVWFLPSPAELTHWLERIGFREIRVVDLNRTLVSEQRSTGWMPFESLDRCLDPHNKYLTVEGYPAPLRAVLIARK